MPEFVVNNQRVDPYKNFKFRLMWDGQYIPGILRVSPLRRTTEVIAQRKGSEQSTERRSPGLSRYVPITIERGITQSRDFEEWAQKVWNLGLSMGAESSQDFRKDIVIEMFNESGQLVLRYRLLRCWPSEYQALPQLDAEGSSTAIESLTLENEGWERDTGVVEPKEPTY
jgi:phage tail-like protein